jgi:S1-C subfamily serine protease
MECRLLGTNSCETIIMGGAQAPYTPESKSGGDYAEFLVQRVVKSNAAMAAAGIEVGDTIIRVNNVYAGSDLEFARLVLSLPKGTELTVWKQNGSRESITL